MCGRYSNRFDGRRLAVRFQAANRGFAFQPNQDIAPTQFSPVVIMEEGQRVLKAMKWGLIPSWAKDTKIGVKCFNARAETVQEKPAFRSSFKSRRCLVPADSFYEWQPREGRKKLRHRIGVRGQEIFAIAGLWAQWAPPQGEAIQSFTVITTEANPALAPIHNRMPVILPLDHEQVWLNPDFTNPHLLINLLKPLNPELTEAVPMDAEDDPPLINPNYLRLVD